MYMSDVFTSIDNIRHDNIRYGNTRYDDTRHDKISRYKGLLSDKSWMNVI